MTFVLRQALIFAYLSCLGAAACGDQSDVLATRAGGEGGSGAAGTPSTPGAGAAALGGAGARGGTGPAGAGTLGASAGSPATGGSSSDPGGASGAGAGGQGSNASGAAGQAAAGMGGAGAGGASAGCPNGCTRSPAYPGCTGQVWQCMLGFYPQEFIQGGCSDLGTDLQRYCCPAAFYSGCEAPCADAKTLDECNLRSDCHPVFNDPGTCGCGTEGCCARFSRCAEGATATCNNAVVSCTVSMPFCDGPTYVMSYANGCYEGCVKPEDCAP